ncbi:glycosyltransferase family 39 protein [Patescibacteria group bacterium]|nr:glycosyltransferase family 39 protein [Patescibacteria group bacterium]
MVKLVNNNLAKKLLLTGIIILGIVLRLLAINQSLWMDEAISALAIKGHSFLGLITKFAPGDTHPPLFYFILKFWSLIFGYSEISLRLPSVILGATTIPVVYLIGKRLAGEKVGIFSALLIATSGLHVYYSQEARMYALSTFAVSLAIYFFLKIGQNAKKADWFIFSLSLLLVGVSDYLPLFAIAALWIWGFLLKKHWSWWKSFLLAHVPLIIFLSLWEPIFRAQSLGTRNYLLAFPAWASVLGTASFQSLSLVWIKFVLGRISFSPNILYGFIVLLASIAFVVGLFNSLKKYKEALIIWLWLIVPLVLAFVGAIFIPGFSYFRLLFILPAFYILLAFGLSNKKYGYVFLSSAVIFNLIFTGIYLFDQNFWREDWRSAVSFVDKKANGDEPILMVYPEPFTPYQWYSSRNSAKAIRIPFDKNISKLVMSSRALYTFDYLLDLTDPSRTLFQEIKADGFQETNVYSFRGVGQIRYWVKI